MTTYSTQLARAAERHDVLGRRRFLRGIGACIGLPAFESLLPGLGRAAGTAVPPLAASATGAPLRTAFLYFPNGAIPSAWWPQETGPDFACRATLNPLEPFRGSVQVLGGLDHRNAEPGPDGAGDHARANGTFLTGVRMKKSATDIRAGISIDQVIARQTGHLTRLPSLEMSCERRRETGACDSGYSCAYQYNLSWSSPTTPMTAESNPRLIFERLFGQGAHGERAANLQRRQQEQRSILDFVMEDARRMQGRLDPADRGKLDQYLTGVRDIEVRIVNAERLGRSPDPELATPAGLPPSYAEHIRLMFDMLVLAFQTDSTRIASVLLAHDGSNRPFGDELAISEGHHDLTHHMDRPEWIEKVQRIDEWYVRQFAEFLGKLRDIKDVDGQSLLHNSMIVYGGGNADANRHTHSNLPIILAGGGGGSLAAGRHVKHGSVPMSNLFLSLADRMGVTGLERFGDSSGRLADV